MAFLLATYGTAQMLFQGRLCVFGKTGFPKEHAIEDVILIGRRFLRLRPVGGAEGRIRLGLLRHGLGPVRKTRNPPDYSDNERDDEAPYDPLRRVPEGQRCRKLQPPRTGVVFSKSLVAI